MSRVLIVRHGPDRGRHLPTLDGAFEHLRDHEPELWNAISFHETGSSATPGLDGVSGIWFWLADPLRETYPECFVEAQAIVDAVRDDVRLANPPESLSSTIKSRQAKLWREAEIPTPRHAAFESREELESLVDSFPFPALVRADFLHSQQGVHYARTPADARALSDDELHLPGVIVEFVDTRVGYERTRPGTVWAKFFHKKRSLVFGDRADRRGVLFATDPIVSLKTCTYKPFRKRHRHPWRIVRGWAKRSVEADNDWWEHGDQPDEILVRATRVLGLSVAAIDYATTADGQTWLWEANPYFYMPRPDRFLLPKARRFPERRARAIDAITEFLRDLAT